MVTVDANKSDIKNGRPGNGKPVKPDPMPVAFPNIPKDILALERFVCWRWTWSDGKNKWDKPPLQITGHFAKSNNKVTWTTINKARAAYESGRFDGIGVVLGKLEGNDLTLAGVDLDDCRDPETGELSEFAQYVISRLNAYAELSPSGTGVKLLMYGSLPDGKADHDRGIEVYVSGRYFTVTGQRLPGCPGEILDRGKELAELFAELFESGTAAKKESRLSDRELALSALEGLNKRRAAGYHDWIRVGMALHSVSDDGDMLAAWDNWSRSCPEKYTEGACQRAWSHFRRLGITIGSLICWAKEDGWTYPRGGSKGHDRPTPSSDVSGPSFANYTLQGINVATEKGPEKDVIKIGLPLPALGRALRELDGGKLWRIGSALYTEDPPGEPLWLDKTESLFAWIGRLLPGDGANCLRWVGGEDKVSQAQFFAYLQQTVEKFDAVEVFPHEPALPRHHYLCPKATGTGKALSELLDRFNPLTPIDRDLIQAFFMTLFWGGTPGQRPAWLVTTNDETDPKKGRGSGKSALAKAGGQLAGGLVQTSVREDMGKLITRLLTPEARRRRVVLLDNIKKLRFSWAELEGLITSDTISGHQLYTGDGRRPNTLVWCLTVNGASLSRDMAQRTVVVKVQRPEYYSPVWEDETRQYIENQRWAIIGDCLTILRQKGLSLTKYSRWGAWEASVLSHVADPAACQTEILRRQDAMDDDAGEATAVRDAFRDELLRRGHKPDTEAIWVTADAAKIAVNKGTGEKYSKNRAGVYLNTLAIDELRKSDQNGTRGWAWRGKDSDPNATLKEINPEPPMPYAETW